VTFTASIVTYEDYAANITNTNRYYQVPYYRSGALWNLVDSSSKGFGNIQSVDFCSNIDISSNTYIETGHYNIDQTQPIVCPTKSELNNWVNTCTTKAYQYKCTLTRVGGASLYSISFGMIITAILAGFM
jgi:hypothetical protein